MELKFINTTDPLYNQELALRYEALRKPLGMPQGSEVSEFEGESLHLVAIEAGRVIGCVLFTPRGERGKLFAMAVAEDMRAMGIGTKLVKALEQKAAGMGISEIYLHARHHAVGFYEGMGYAVEGDPFIEVGIRHMMMRKGI